MTTQADADGPRHEEQGMQRLIVWRTGADLSLSAAYVRELRRRIEEDAYGTEYVAEEIARRMLSLGDL